jgi:hypothetical protein
LPGEPSSARADVEATHAADAAIASRVPEIRIIEFSN